MALASLLVLYKKQKVLFAVDCIENYYLNMNHASPVLSILLIALLLCFVITQNIFFYLFLFYSYNHLPDLTLLFFLLLFVFYQAYSIPDLQVLNLLKNIHTILWHEDHTPNNHQSVILMF